MFCANCGSSVQESARFCVKCGAPQAVEADPVQAGPSAGGWGPAGAAPAGASPGPWQAGAYPGVTGAPGRARVTSAAPGLTAPRPGDVLAGLGTVLAVVALFLPWYTLRIRTSQQQRPPSNSVAIKAGQLAHAICHSQPHAPPCSSNAGSLSVTALGTGAGGWRYAILVLGIVLVLYLLGRTMSAVAQASSGFHGQLLIVLAVIEAILMMAALLSNPLKIFGFAATISLSAGAFLGLVAALATVAGGILSVASQRRPGATSQTGPGAPAGAS